MVWIYALIPALVAGAFATGWVIFRKRMRKETGAHIGSASWPRAKMPLALVFDEADELPFRRAVRWWNKQLGASLFLPVGDVGPGAVVPVVGYTKDPDPDKNRTAYTSYRRAGTKMLTASVHVASMAHLASKQRDRIAAHELGHALGLPHDIDNPSSIMYPTVNGGRGFKLLSRDREFIKNRYV